MALSANSPKYLLVRGMRHLVSDPDAIRPGRPNSPRSRNRFRDAEVGSMFQRSQAVYNSDGWLTVASPRLIQKIPRLFGYQ